MKSINMVYIYKTKYVLKCMCHNNILKLQYGLIEINNKNSRFYIKKIGLDIMTCA